MTVTVTSNQSRDNGQWWKLMIPQPILCSISWKMQNSNVIYSLPVLMQKEQMVSQGRRYGREHGTWSLEVQSQTNPPLLHSEYSQATSMSMCRGMYVLTVIDAMYVFVCCGDGASLCYVSFTVPGIFSCRNDGSINPAPLQRSRFRHEDEQ